MILERRSWWQRLRRAPRLWLYHYRIISRFASYRRAAMAALRLTWAAVR